MTEDQVLELVRARRIVPFADFVHAIAGAPVKGSWWGHPRGHEIFNLSGVAMRECIQVKLVAGKETLLHRSIFPAFARVVTDEEWRRPRAEALSADAKKLLALVEAAATTRVDQVAKSWGVKTSVVSERRRELQRALLVHADDEHTEKGFHVTILVPWSRWVSPDVKKAAKKLSLDEALAELRAAAGGAASALDEAAAQPRRRRSRA